MPDCEPSEDGLYQDPDLARFYDIENPWSDDLEYCLRLANDAQSVLDLGCGTGQLAARMANGRTVFGVDPAGAMLEIARRRPGGQRVTWVQADARAVRLGRRFDLVLLTGHAFQVFLTDADQAAVLSTIAEHLAPGGRFIFDTRNPVVEEWREWTPELSMRYIECSGLGAVRAWNDVVHDTATGIVTYQTHYQIVESGQHIEAASKIRFVTRQVLAEALEGAGLTVDEWLGDWKGGGHEPASPEIIPMGRLR